MNNTKRRKRFYKIVILEDFNIKTPAQLNYLIERYSKKYKYGIVTKLLDYPKSKSIIKIVSEYRHINWCFISSYEEPALYSFNVNALQQEIDEDDFLNKVNNLFNKNFKYIRYYPVKNILVNFMPKYSKDYVLERTLRMQHKGKIPINTGILGKKEYMKKRRRLLKSIFG